MMIYAPCTPARIITTSHRNRSDDYRTYCRRVHTARRNLARLRYRRDLCQTSRLVFPAVAGVAITRPVTR